MSPWVIGMVLAKPITKKLLYVFGFKNLLFVNAICLGVSILLFTLIQHILILLIVCLLFCNGFCSSLQVNLINIITYTDIENINLSKATSFASVIQQLSMCFGIIVSAFILSYYSKGALNIAKFNIIVFKETFIIIGSLLLMTSIIFLFLLSNDGLSVSRSKKS